MILLTSFREYTDFLEDLEEDPTYRENVNIYKGKQAPCFVSLKLTLAIFYALHSSPIFILLNYSIPVLSCKHVFIKGLSQQL